MLSYKSSINETKKYSEINMSEFEPVVKINLRGKKKRFYN